MADATCREGNRGALSLELGISQSFPQLNQSQADIERQIDTPIRLIGLESESVRTFQEWAREGRLLTPLFGVGYEISDCCTIGVRVGGSEGREQNDRLLLIGPLTADFRYVAIFINGFASFYPLGRPVWQRGSKNQAHNLRDGKPLLWQALGATRFIQEGHVQYRLGGLPLYSNSVRHDDWVGGYHVGLGWEWALGPRWNAQVMASYSFYFDRSDEFDGFGLNYLIVFRF